MNKIFFLLLIVFQILQSMGFNGLFDLPQLFMILCILSLFVFRQQFRITFGFSLVFLSLYIQLAVTIKIIYIIAIEIDFVEMYFRDNYEKSSYVRYLRAFLGEHANIKTS